MLSKINNTEYPERKEFLKHLRENKLTLKEYYYKYFPRKDLFSGESIDFTDEEHYLSSLFVSRENMVKYLLENKDDATIKELLLARKKLKSLKYLPSTSEARTSVVPSPALVKKLGFDIQSVSDSVGLINRYNYSAQIERVAERVKINIDTREQTPLKFSRPSEITKLDVGDYSCQNNFTGCFVERKSLMDFCGTMSSGFERFSAEVVRAQELGFHLCVVVEEKIETISQLNVANENRFVKGSPEFYFGRMRKLCENYPNVQFLFVAGRYEAARIIESIFSIKGGFSSLDLQFFCDNKQI